MGDDEGKWRWKLYWMQWSNSAVNTTAAERYKSVNFMGEGVSQDGVIFLNVPLALG